MALNKRELLEKYRLTLIEVDTLTRQRDYINRVVGGPSGITSIQITGMPRGTNNPEAARAQQDTGASDEKDLEIICKLNDKIAELSSMLSTCEQILEGIEDQRARVILRNYYTLGWSDDKIAGKLGYVRQHITRLRQEAIGMLN